MNKIRLVALSIFICILFFLLQNKEINFVSLVNAQTCSVPAQVTGVVITFPSCVGDVCNFTQGSCAWTVAADATNYNVIITAVETGAIIINQQVASSSASIAFPVAQSNTYKCDISATNSCGTGPVGTSSLLCKVDAIIATPTPTPILTSTPAPVIPVVGNEMPLMFFGILSIVLIIGGIKAFRF